LLPFHRGLACRCENLVRGRHLLGEAQALRPVARQHRGELGIEFLGRRGRAGVASAGSSLASAGFGMTTTVMVPRGASADTIVSGPDARTSSKSSLNIASISWL
jgi:hypothetical protein